jgi:hypothetical protein
VARVQECYSITDNPSNPTFEKVYFSDLKNVDLDIKIDGVLDLSIPITFNGVI